MSHSDHYYGTNAELYEARRKDKPMWGLEQSVVERWVSHGPVLDVPCGTGRYFDIYKDKGLDFIGMDISTDMLNMTRERFPDAKLDLGSVHNMPYADKQFGTVVCTRLVHWFDLEQTRSAMKEMFRVGEHVLVTLGLGEEKRVTTTYDHSEDNWKRVIEGYYPQRELLQVNEGRNVWYAYYLRKPTMDDVRDQFQDREETCIQDLIDVWCRLFRLGDGERYGVDLSQMKRLDFVYRTCVGHFGTR